MPGSVQSAAPPREHVSDEIIGFYCQQALLSDVGVRFRKTRETGALMALAAHAGHAPPDRFENLDVPTPFGAIYRYEDYEAAVSLDRDAARASVLELRAWVETKLRERTGQYRAAAILRIETGRRRMEPIYSEASAAMVFAGYPIEFH